MLVVGRVCILTERREWKGGRGDMLLYDGGKSKRILCDTS